MALLHRCYLLIHPKRLVYCKPFLPHHSFHSVSQSPQLIHQHWPGIDQDLFCQKEGPSVIFSGVHCTEVSSSGRRVIRGAFKREQERSSLRTRHEGRCVNLNLYKAKNVLPHLSLPRLPPNLVPRGEEWGPSQTKHSNNSLSPFPFSKALKPVLGVKHLLTDVLSRSKVRIRADAYAVCNVPCAEGQ